MDNEQNRRADDKRAPGQLQWGESSEGAAPVKSFKQAFHAATNSGEGYDDAIAAGLRAATAAAPTKMTDGDITAIWQTMPGGPAGWLKSFGFLQFARSVEEQVLENNVSPAAPASADNPSTAGDELQQLRRRVSELEAARIAYASEFPLTADGDPDIGNIHANIRALKARLSDNPSTAGAAKGGITSIEGLTRYGVGGDGELQEMVCGDAYLVADIEAALAESRLAAPALIPSEVRNAALEEAAELAIKLTAVPRDVLGPPTVPMKARAYAGGCIADSIRALKTASAQGEKGGDDAAE